MFLVGEASLQRMRIKGDITNTLKFFIGSQSRNMFLMYEICFVSERKKLRKSSSLIYSLQSAAT